MAKGVAKKKQLASNPSANSVAEWVPVCDALLEEFCIQLKNWRQHVENLKLVESSHFETQEAGLTSVDRIEDAINRLKKERPSCFKDARTSRIYSDTISALTAIRDEYRPPIRKRLLHFVLPDRLYRWCFPSLGTPDDFAQSRNLTGTLASLPTKEASDEPVDSKKQSARLDGAPSFSTGDQTTVQKAAQTSTPRKSPKTYCFMNERPSDKIPKDRTWYLHDYIEILLRREVKNLDLADQAPVVVAHFKLEDLVSERALHFLKSENLSTGRYAQCTRNAHELYISRPNNQKKLTLQAKVPEDLAGSKLVLKTMFLSWEDIFGTNNEVPEKLGLQTFLPFKNKILDDATQKMGVPERGIKSLLEHLPSSNHSPISLFPLIKNRNHFVLLAFNNAERKIYYFDPNGSRMPNSLQGVLQRQFQDFEITCNQTGFQTDHYNCGPWVTEAAIDIAKSGFPTNERPLFNQSPPKMDQVRNCHKPILEQHYREDALKCAVTTSLQGALQGILIQFLDTKRKKYDVMRMLGGNQTQENHTESMSSVGVNPKTVSFTKVMGACVQILKEEAKSAVVGDAATESSVKTLFDEFVEFFEQLDGDKEKNIVRLKIRSWLDQMPTCSNSFFENQFNDLKRRLLSSDVGESADSTKTILDTLGEAVPTVLRRVRSESNMSLSKTSPSEGASKNSTSASESASSTLSGESNSQKIFSLGDPSAQTRLRASSFPMISCTAS